MRLSRPTRATKDKTYRGTEDAPLVSVLTFAMSSSQLPCSNDVEFFSSYKDFRRGFLSRRPALMLLICIEKKDFG